MAPISPISDLTPTRYCIKFQGGFKYQLVEDAVWKTNIIPPEDIDIKFITLYKSGELLLKTGFAWNGVSGPTIQRNTNRRGGAFHDAIYRLRRFGLLEFLNFDEFRKLADDMLKIIWIADGMWSWVASFEVSVLNKFGDPAARPSGEPYIMVSP
jgi:hypothetical protein